MVYFQTAWLELPTLVQFEIWNLHFGPHNLANETWHLNFGAQILTIKIWDQGSVSLYAATDIVQISKKGRKARQNFLQKATEVDEKRRKLMILWHENLDFG